MPEVHLEKLNLAELKALRKNVEKAIATYEARKLSEARAVLEEKARELGVSLDAVLGAKGKAAGATVPPKYRHPENAELTWTGRGRSPKWLAEHEKNGGSRDDFLIR